jgi:ribosomal protein S12 methylthiotransferase accessory factor YcaO
MRRLRLTRPTPETRDDCEPRDLTKVAAIKLAEVEHALIEAVAAVALERQLGLSVLRVVQDQAHAPGELPRGTVTEQPMY